MKLTQKIVALTGIVAFAATPLFAGTGKTFKETVVVEEEATPWYSATLSTGFDSLYMFRGVNFLGRKYNANQWDSYGDSLYWTGLNFTWNITDVDSLSLGTWMAFGLGNTYNGYKELNIPINYTRTIGDLALGFGYTFYYNLPYGTNPDTFSNELNISAAYNFDLGFMSLTPKVTYFYNLGPQRDTNQADLGGSGGNGAGTSYLDLRLTGSIPVYKEVVSLAPYTALGINFGYNMEPDPTNLANGGSGLQEFSGFNNWEMGVSMPIAINDVITLTGYVAYSYAFLNLNGTTLPSTFWGGANIAFAF